MGVKFIFDDSVVRDVKDVQAALLIQEILGVLDIKFERIIILPLDGEENEINGVDLKKWR